MQPRILYIDDDKTAHVIFKEYARQIIGKVSVVSAFDGEEGIRAYSKYDDIFDPIHLVITDYTMPIKNGQEVVHAIRSADPVVPICVASSRGPDALQKMGINGANWLLSKPFKREELEAILKATFKPSQ